MKEGQIIRTIQNNGETVTFRYPRWQDVPAYVEMCNILHQERVMAYHAETSFAKGCERLSGFLVDLETGKRAHLLIEVAGQIVGEGSLQVDRAHRMGTLGIKIIGRCRRRGLGREMMLLLGGGRSKVRSETDLLACLASERGCDSTLSKSWIPRSGTCARMVQHER